VAVVAALDLALFGVEFGINRWLSPRAAVPGPEAASFRMINATLWRAARSGSAASKGITSLRPCSAALPTPRSQAG